MAEIIEGVDGTEYLVRAERPPTPDDLDEAAPAAAPEPPPPDVLVCRPDLGPGAHTLVTGSQLRRRPDGSAQLPAGLVPAEVLDQPPGTVLAHPRDQACPHQDQDDAAPPRKGRR